MQQEELFHDYLIYLYTEKGLSDNTIHAYRMDIRQFLSSITCSINTISPSQIEEYFMNLKHLKESTYLRKIISLRSFFIFLSKIKNMEMAGIDILTMPKIWSTIPHTISEKQMQCLLSLPSQTTYNGIRDKAIMELLYASGMRVSELCSLSIYDIGDYGVTILHGKGGKRRVVPLHIVALDALDKYLLKRDICIKNIKEKSLFLSSRGNPMSRGVVWAMIKKYAQQVDITISPHGFRHSFATHLLDHNMDLSIIQRFLGHSSINTTEIYTHVSMEKLKKTFHSCHPREPISSDIQKSKEFIDNMER